jgi:hypothetical protein
VLVADLPEKSDWSKVDKQLKSDPEGTQDLPVPSLGGPEGGAQHPLIERFGNPKGVILEFKANRIQRRHALEALKEYHNGQLTVARTQIQEAVRIRTAEARQQAEQYLARIDTEYIQYLAALGMRNVDERQRMLIRLHEQTSTNLKQVLDADWPEKLRERSIDQIMELHDRFAAKLTRELDQLTEETNG